MAKNHRQNHDFQIVHFLAGSCHTPDGAYSLLCDLLEDRQTALKNVTAARFRQDAKRIRAQRLIDSSDEAEQLEGKAEMAEMEAFDAMTNANITAAEDEVAFIKSCMDKLEPHRKYANLPLPQAHEAAQEEEWKLELIARAENFLITTGTIATDHFATMRMHPAFLTEILPAINQVKQLMQQQDGIESLFQKKLLPNQIDIPTVLLPAPESSIK